MSLRCRGGLRLRSRCHRLRVGLARCRCRRALVDLRSAVITVACRQNAGVLRSAQNDKLLVVTEVDLSKGPSAERCLLASFCGRLFLLEVLWGAGKHFP